MTGADRVVRTVDGPVAPDSLGITSMHEHIWMDGGPLLAVHGYPSEVEGPWDGAVAVEARWNPGAHPANYRLTDAEAAVPEVASWAAAGGGTLVELTPPSLGRDPARVRDIARLAGAQVVLGAGHYLEPVHEPWVREASVVTIADRLVIELTAGVGTTGIRPGILGEIGTSDPVSAGERRVLQAVAAASRATGVAVSVHVHPWGHEGPTVLDALTAAGADPERVILGHVTTAIDRPDLLRRLADRGATLGFDLFGFDHSLLGTGRWPPSDRDVALVIGGLVWDGYREHIVLGQDIGVRTRYRRWGGWGYDHLLRHVVPLLLEVGIDQADIDAMLIANPARLLAVPA